MLSEKEIEEQRRVKIIQFRAQAEQYNFTREYSKAMQFYVRAGLLGDKESIEEVCAKLKDGYGMSYNYDEIFRCMMLGAKLGIADAMYETGVCYSNGLGTDKDEAEAMHWFSEGAKAGSKAAKLSLRTYNFDFSMESFEGSSAYADVVYQKLFHKKASLTKDATQLVIFDGGQPAAACYVRKDPELAAYTICLLGVLPEYRGLGLSEDLIQEAIGLVEQNQGKTVALMLQPAQKEYYSKIEFYPESSSDNKEGFCWAVKRLEEE